MKAVVTGASGFVGSFLCKHLSERGWEVISLLRETSIPRWLEGLEVRRMFADVCKAETLGACVEGADVVFHAAGLVKSNSRSEFMKVNYDGTRNLVNACLTAKSPPHRFVFVSSQAAAGPSPDREGIDENSAPSPVSAYGESKLAAEKWIAGVKGLETVIVRPSAVYGPRDPETLNFFRIVSRLRIRPVLSGGSLLVSMIDVRDLVNGIRLAGEVPAARGGTYFLSAQRPFSMKEVLTAVSRALKKNTFEVPVAKLILSAGAEISQFVSQFGDGKAALSHLKVAELTQRYWVVRTDRALEELGFKASIPLSDGIANAARWYVENGWI